MPVGFFTPKATERFANKILANFERKFAGRPVMREFVGNSLERTDGGLELSTKLNLPKAKKTISERISEIFSWRRPKRTTDVRTEIDAELNEGNREFIEKLKNLKERSGNKTVNSYTPEAILDIVRVKKTNPEIAEELTSRLRHGELSKTSTASLYDLSKSKPKVFEIVSKHADKKQVEGVNALRNLKFAEAEKVKLFPTKSVLKIEEVASQRKEAVNKVLDNKFFKGIIEKNLNAKDEAQIGKFVEMASDRPKGTERFLNEVEESINRNRPEGNKVKISDMPIEKINELVQVHHGNPSQVRSILSIIERFNTCDAKEIEVILEYERNGIPVEKYVKEYFQNKNSFYNNGSKSLTCDLGEYIKFRRKTGDLYSEILKRKDSKETSEFFEYQLLRFQSNKSALERIKRDGIIPKNEQELEELIDLYNNTQGKVTEEMLNSTVMQKRA